MSDGARGFTILGYHDRNGETAAGYITPPLGVDPLDFAWADALGIWLETVAADAVFVAAFDGELPLVGTAENLPRPPENWQAWRQQRVREAGGHMRQFTVLGVDLAADRVEAQLLQAYHWVDAAFTYLRASLRLAENRGEVNPEVESLGGGQYSEKRFVAAFEGRIVPVARLDDVKNAYEASLARHRAAEA